MYLVAIRKRLGSNDFLQFTMDEYNCFAYLVPMIVYVPASFAWTFATGDYSWYTHTEQNCIYTICVHITFGLYVISKLPATYEFYTVYTLAVAVASSNFNIRHRNGFVLLYSRAWSHHSHIGFDQHGAAELEANFRAPRVP